MKTILAALLAATLASGPKEVPKEKKAEEPREPVGVLSMVYDPNLMEGFLQPPAYHYWNASLHQCVVSWGEGYQMCIWANADTDLCVMGLQVRGKNGWHFKKNKCSTGEQYPDESPTL